MFRAGLIQAGQVLAAALGGLAFDRLGVPAAWLSGAAAVVIVMGGLRLGAPLARPLADLGMLLSGVVMGAGITPQALQAVALYPLSLAVLALAVVSVTGASAFYLVRLAGWRRDDAILASVPGALTTVMAVAADRNAALGPIAVVQSVRLLVLVAVLPSLVSLAGGGAGGALPGAGQALAGPEPFAVTVGSGLLLGLALERLGVAAPILLGGTLASAVLHGTELAPGVPPPPVTAFAFVLVGIYIAERVRTLDGRAFLRTLPAALGSLAIGAGVAGAFATASAAIARVGLPDALVAFAPGGLEAMMVLAVVLHLDPLYVGIHHLARFLSIGFLLPVMFAGLRRP
ncbi:AbrB family transcriptional regulator [Salinarimonas soli]|uniref:AbrB family transcriptional regulator n=2 Tax=Salinarimonas soli TaxID=1638099 RepID=A0A5B2V8J5_9HYPH|nr:AbrB family transcriptional regulator [Salinarimonas soli]